MLVVRVQKLVRLAKTMTPTGYTIYNPFDNWVHESGKVVLVGEAAHPLMVRQLANCTLYVSRQLIMAVYAAQRISQRRNVDRGCHDIINSLFSPGG